MAAVKLIMNFVDFLKFDVMNCFVGKLSFTDKRFLCSVFPELLRLSPVLLIGRTVTVLHCSCSVYIYNLLSVVLIVFSLHGYKRIRTGSLRSRPSSTVKGAREGDPSSAGDSASHLLLTGLGAVGGWWGVESPGGSVC